MTSPAAHTLMQSRVLVFDSQRELETAVAGEFLRIVNAALGSRPLCHVALSGGGTPRGVYRLLGKGPENTEIDWTRVHLYFGDERMVPPTDEESNYRMVYAELISRIPIPAENVHRIRGEMPAPEAAASYAKELSAIFTGKDNTFDLVLLGVGEDGHTASLFPGTDAVNETNEPVTAVYVPSHGAWRTTLTLPIINRSRDVRFIVAGSGKAEIIRRLLSADAPTGDLPASLIRPETGTLRWMLDREAAELI